MFAKGKEDAAPTPINSGWAGFGAKVTDQTVLPFPHSGWPVKESIAPPSMSGVQTATPGLAQVSTALIWVLPAPGGKA